MKEGKKIEKTFMGKIIDSIFSGMLFWPSVIILGVKYGWMMPIFTTLLVIGIILSDKSNNFPK